MVRRLRDLVAGLISSPSEPLSEATSAVRGLSQVTQVSISGGILRGAAVGCQVRGDLEGCLRPSITCHLCDYVGELVKVYVLNDHSLF